MYNLLKNKKKLLLFYINIGVNLFKIIKHINESCRNMNSFSTSHMELNTK